MGAATGRRPEGAAATHSLSAKAITTIIARTAEMAQAVDFPVKSDTPEHRLHVNRQRTSLVHGRKRTSRVSGAPLQWGQMIRRMGS